MNKNKFLNLIGISVIIYIVTVPFLGLPLWESLLPIIILDVLTVKYFSWKVHNWTWEERIGDVISIATVFVLGYLRASIVSVSHTTLPLWSQYVIGVFIVDTFGYWIHYFAHGDNWLWKLHRVHHSRKSPDILNASTEHFGDALIRLIAPGLVLIFLGFDHQVIVAISALTSLIGTVSHLNLDLSIPKPLIWLVVSPITHRLHHHKNEIAVNNGNITHLWDHLMGTYCLYEMKPDEYGLQEEQQISNNPIYIFYIKLF
jgi:sterol desaturase/sphingolipid hydroxylase (fatty acid hydroxylase superfamily)